MQFLPRQKAGNRKLETQKAARRSAGRAGRYCVQALLSIGMAVGVYAAAQPELALKLPEPNLNKSEFTDDAKFGKDPFFPNTARRLVTNEVATEAIKLPSVKNVKLQGISGPKEHRLAILNNRTFGIGEEAELKIDGHLVRVRLVEFRERTVMVSINGGPPQEVLAGQRF